MSAILNRPLFRQGGGGAELPRVVDAPQLPWGEVGNRTLDATVRAPVEFYRNMFTGGDEQPATQRILEGYPEIDEQARIEATLEGLLPSQKEFVLDMLARGMSLDYAIHQLRTKIIFEQHRGDVAGLLPDPPPYVPPTEAEMLERVGPQARAMMEHEGYSADVAVPSVRRSIRAFGEERPHSVSETPSEGRLRQPSRFQGGGPVMPQQAMMAPPQQAMMAAPPQAMMAAPPQGAGLDALMAQAPQALGAGGGQTAAEMEKMGSQYVNEMMSAVDMAENPEDLINAIRGTDVPIGDRYTELAQIVGPDDAQSTPESVLVLVQPTLMMTEQGALDSGVGNLMQGMASDTEMATDTGIPTPMGEGIGNLMMAGAPPPDMMMAGAPPPDMMMARRGGPVQNFWGGGPVVQKFAYGNGVYSPFDELLKKNKEKPLGEYYQDILGPVQSILGRTQKEEEYSQGLLLADIADRAFAFGAGVSPDTGKPITHLSTAAQLGAVSKTLPKALVASAGEEAAQTREIKKFALAAAMSERETSLKRREALQLEAFKAQVERTKPDWDIRTIDGQIVVTNKKYPISSRVIGDHGRDVIKIVNDRVVRVSPDLEKEPTILLDLSDQEAGRKIWGSSKPALIAAFLADNKASVIAWGEGTLEDTVLANRIEAAVYERAKRTVDQAGNLQGFTVPPWMATAIRKKYGPDHKDILFLTGSLDDIKPAAGMAELSGDMPERSSGGPVVQNFNEGGGAELDTDLSRTGGDIISGRYNPEKAAGLWLPLQEAANWSVGQLQELGMAKGDLPFQETAGAKIELQALKGATSRFFTEGAQGGRTLSPEYENLQKEIQAMGGWRTNVNLLLKLKQIREAIQGKVAKHHYVISMEDSVSKASGQTQQAGGARGEEPLTTAKGQLGNAISKKAEGLDLINEYDRAITMLEGYLYGDRPSVSEILRSMDR